MSYQYSPQAFGLMAPDHDGPIDWVKRTHGLIAKQMPKRKGGGPKT